MGSGSMDHRPYICGNHAGMARQVLPVQPLEGLFSKSENMKFKKGEELT